jgi:hypothetical protein
MIKQLMLMNDKLADISDAVLMTYTYMQDEENRDEVIVDKRSAEDGVDNLIINDDKANGELSETDLATIRANDMKLVDEKQTIIVDPLTSQAIIIPKPAKKPVLTDQEISDLMNRIIKEEPETGKRI